MLKLSLIVLVILAIMTVQTQKMRHAVVYLGAFSLTISFIYLLYNAPDVAIAEAIIGSTLSTILYLVALQKYKIFTVYYCLSEAEFEDQSHLTAEHLQFKKLLDKYCAKQELEPQIIYTVDATKTIIEHHPYALIVQNEPTNIKIWGHPENYKMDSLISFFDRELHFKVPIEFIQVEEVIE
ncbi:DUF4040 domain-containing protein [Fusibacter sp. 3D3]|uniref:Na(+)/H(+) antiporter subunit B n=1 Tax=Fusibacter sp. 3D3 TaxID=1048380 RepID=UPI0008539732|nr:DUF4040 domain-containing protein [Fusibacter sp. 3D3]GAU77933.1 hypothetical protein F3D3_2562 [Fusibacter sp. 3D3]